MALFASLIRAAAIAAFAGAAVAQAQALVTKAELERGQASYNEHCGACHSLDENRAGPKHRGVLGRPVGRVPGFEYSNALRAARKCWTRPMLLKWMKDPEAVFPGQQMWFSVDDESVRIDIVRYFESLQPHVKKRC
jgi:cytochrome c